VRILIVRLGALGDIVHALPACAALRDTWPDATIDWLVDARHREILDLVPAIDECVCLPSTVSAQLGVVSELRQRRYDLAIDLQGLIKSAIFARASGAKRTAGFRAAQLRERAAALLYTETHDASPFPHVVLKNLALVRALGARGGDLRFALRIPSSSVTATVNAMPGFRDGVPYALLNPGAAWSNKRWPPERFGGVAAALRDRHGLPSLVAWGPGEERLAQAAVGSSRGAAQAAPPTSVHDLVALTANAALVVAGDTGPLHIAVALGRPVVAIHGPTSPARNGPLRDEDAAVSRFDACPCHHQRRCNAARWCLDDVTVDDVMGAIDRRLATLRPRGAA
jgi:heptosyltransferase-1